jgi:hypothetical protein
MIGSDRIVKFVGRDYTAILLDPEWDPKVAVPSGLPLDETVQKIADAAAPDGTSARFQVIWNGEDAPPICGGLHRSHRGKRLAVKANKSYWDVIWDLCLQHAYVCRVSKSSIIIEEPSTQTTQSLKDAPRLIYGKTLTKLEIKRKFAREKVPQIVIVAWDPITRKKIEITYPPKRNVIVKGTDALGVPIATKKDDQQYLPGPKGITDRKALLRYARMRFYHMGRGETVYSMGTSHIMIDKPQSGQKTLDIGWNSDKIAGQSHNLLQLRPGNAVGVQFDPFNRQHLRALEVGQRVEYIVSLGYRPQVAQFIANNIDRMEMFRQEYYYNRGDISYDVESGLEIEIEAVNFSYAVREIHFAESGNPDAVSGAA